METFSLSPSDVRCIDLFLLRSLGSFRWWVRVSVPLLHLHLHLLLLLQLQLPSTVPLRYCYGPVTPPFRFRPDSVQILLRFRAMPVLPMCFRENPPRHKPLPLTEDVLG